MCTHKRGLVGHHFETFSVSKLVSSGPSLGTWLLDFMQGIVLFMMLGMESERFKLDHRMKFVFKNV